MFTCDPRENRKDQRFRVAEVVYENLGLLIVVHALPMNAFSLAVSRCNNSPIKDIRLAVFACLKRIAGSMKQLTTAVRKHNAR